MIGPFVHLNSLLTIIAFNYFVLLKVAGCVVAIWILLVRGRPSSICSSAILNVAACYCQEEPASLVILSRQSLTCILDTGTIRNEK